MQKRLFISYASEDHPLVKEWIVNHLKAGGHTVWFDDQLVAGQDWQAQLLQQIEQSDALIYCMTPEAVESEWCRWELAQAVDLGKPIIPVLLQANTQLPDELKKLQFVDFSKGPTGDAVARLMGGLLTLSPEQVPPAPTKPQGLPPQVRKEKQSSKSMDDTGRILVLVAIIGGLTTIIAAVIGILPELLDRSTDPTEILAPTRTIQVQVPPTPTATLESTNTPVPTDTLPPITPATEMLAPSETNGPLPTNTPSSLNTIVDPCDGTITNPDSDATVINVVYLEPSLDSQRQTSVRVGQIFEIRRQQVDETDTIWYLIYDNDQRLGWLIARYIELSDSC